MDRKDVVSGLLGQKVVLAGMVFNVFEMLHASSAAANPTFAHTLSGTIADERRHVGFGENRIGSLIKEHPEKRSEIEKMQQEMTYYMLRVFSDSFRSGPAPERSGDAPDVEWHGTNLATASPEELEGVLSDTVLAEFKTRLGRIGLEYQSPTVPA